MGPRCGTEEGARCWLNAEPCGLICGLVTWFLVFYGQFTTTFCVILPWLGPGVLGIGNIILFNIFSILAVYSHYKAMTTDPGAVPRDALPLPSDDEEHDYEAGDKVNGNKFRKFCKRCKSFKPARSHHCSICRRCIIKMDHHCPWVNNCIGIGNHKLFLLFLLWVSLISVYAIILIVIKYSGCLNNGDACGSATDHLLTMFLFIESILFGLFTSCMKADQATVVSTNLTQIDRLQNLNYESKWEVNEVFGSPVSSSCQLHWLYPVPVCFPSSIKDDIYGYTLPLPEKNRPASVGSGSNTGVASTPSEEDESHEMMPLTAARSPQEATTTYNPLSIGSPTRDRRSGSGGSGNINPFDASDRDRDISTGAGPGYAALSMSLDGASTKTSRQQQLSVSRERDLFHHSYLPNYESKEEATNVMDRNRDSSVSGSNGFISSNGHSGNSNSSNLRTSPQHTARFHTPDHGKLSPPTPELSNGNSNSRGSQGNGHGMYPSPVHINGLNYASEREVQGMHESMLMGKQITMRKRLSPPS